MTDREKEEAEKITKDNRLVRKLDLEMAIAEILPHPSPKAHLEQYTITPEVAAEILYMATYIYNDITDKTVIDLGCGTGRLAIAATLLGAKEVVGVDIDRTAIRQAIKNAEKLGVKEKVEWIIADIDVMRGNFDTILQNPPYGVQKRQADRKFLEKALQIGKRVYSLHKGVKTRGKLKYHQPTLTSTVTSPFLKKHIENNGGEIKAVYVLLMNIPHIFAFHQKRRHQFAVNLYVIERKEQKVY
jgi:putative methylase